uniref:Uncharacterized protein n=1 Tax=Anguilla anguilla TaxID=7936 RepID=A0A0E9VNC7_ANGAN
MSVDVHKNAPVEKV